MNTHIIHALTAFALMLAGWSALTYFVVRRTHGPRERRFMIRASLICMLCIIAVAALEQYVIKGYMSGFGAIMYVTLVILGRKQREIRREEAANA